ncbi:UDP-N-acetylmuramoyl-L-alanine--D-glutamate ligase [Pseudoclavibacter caeni]|jgi:UDP-N-acetylmuramoylalanine--D-glutamate ligase|nr:UDP-N-acetylmuramoyl-L-alanine--D-glutamate ligase [Pseudoclavibacter caeni]NYJ97042.1 UDP-N-acetylmuramoylalanine--D-glutamate ligase [Pseudoclavibacter caeni]
MGERDDETTWVPGEMIDLAGRRVAVLGLSVTGFSAADTLVELGATVLATGRSAGAEHIDLLGVIGGTWEPSARDGDEADILARFRPDAVVVSPGFRPAHPAVRWAVEHGVPLLTDIDLAWQVQLRRGLATRWLCVTGTNGKTTTVEMAGAMLAESGLRAGCCGNIGVPVLDLVREPDPYDVLVVELSSFQLHYLRGISPWASVCLNIDADHLDWHGGMAAYAAAKARVYEHTQEACVYPVGDERVLRMVEEADVVEGCRAIGVTRGAPAIGQIGVVDGVVADRAFIADRATHAQEITTLQALAEHGLALPHLVDDALAATALARSAGAEPAAIDRALRAFRPDGHRLAPVAEVDGVMWIDDSKATNPHAARVAVEAFDSVVWIVGGMLKGLDLAPLVAAEHGRLRGAVVVGADRSGVLDLFARLAPEVPVREVTAQARPGDDAAGAAVMREAVDAAAGLARPGDAVLLAPAAASWDQFVSYGRRGDLFAAAVHRLEERG